MKNKFKIKSKVWLYPGMAGWHFVGVPKKESDQIQKSFGAKKRGWGSLPVVVTLGKSKWKTSIFSDKRSGTYLLPLKKEIRKKEDIYDKDSVVFEIEIKA